MTLFKTITKLNGKLVCKICNKEFEASSDGVHKFNLHVSLHENFRFNPKRKEQRKKISDGLKKRWVETKELERLGKIVRGEKV